jgi:hypothetical protein
MMKPFFTGNIKQQSEKEEQEVKMEQEETLSPVESTIDPFCSDSKTGRRTRGRKKTSTRKRNKLLLVYTISSSPFSFRLIGVCEKSPHKKMEKRCEWGQRYTEINPEESDSFPCCRADFCGAYQTLKFPESSTCTAQTMLSLVYSCLPGVLRREKNVHSERRVLLSGTWKVKHNLRNQGILRLHVSFSHVPWCNKEYENLENKLYEENSEYKRRGKKKKGCVESCSQLLRRNNNPTAPQSKCEDQLMISVLRFN